MASHQKLSQACSICHRKKIKCDLASNQPPCTNCRIGDLPCRPHKRKRKRYDLSPSPTREASPSRNSYSAESHRPLLASAGTKASVQPSGHDPPGRLLRTENDSRPVDEQSRGFTDQSTPGCAESYIGRDAYLDGSIPPESMVASSAQASEGVSDTQLQVLHLCKAFDMPPRSVRTSLIDKFMEHCLPWMPIVDRRWLEEQPDHSPSPLLLQSVFLAGSRVSAHALIGATSEDYYQRAKALFFSGHEKNPLISIVAALLLHWWNPTGPEQISASSSGFWVRIAAGLAYQIGLHKEPASTPDRSFRRRVWWTLVWRDNVISVGVGRPRTINLKDSNVGLPSVKDFPNSNYDARLFVAFCSLCQLQGDITEYRRRKTFTGSKRQKFENALYRWVKELPPEFRLFRASSDRTLAPYNFKARQLAVVYFVILIILHRRDEPSTPSSTPSLVASSFISGIFEEFLSRDELRYLGPVYAFYALAAGLSQLSGYRYPGLDSAAEDEFRVISLSLEQLSDRWGSAAEALRALKAARNSVMRQPQLSTAPSPVSADVLPFFNDFGPDLCRQWHLLDLPTEQPFPEIAYAGDEKSRSLPIANGDVYRSGETTRRGDLGQNDLLTMSQTPISTAQHDPMLYPGPGDLFPDHLYDYPWNELDPVGSWLLGDLGLDNALGPSI